MLISQGMDVDEVSRQIGVSRQTFYRWRKEFGGMRVDQARRLKLLQKENLRLKHIVNSWMNYADRLDPVAVDVTLRDEYKANDRGVRVRDDLVTNDYQSSGRNGKRNHHKSYGYLRTPELSEHIKKFLGL